MSVFYILVGLALFFGYLISIALLVEAAQDKGHYTEGAGMLWAIGILASPVVLGLCVCALPDKRLRELIAASGKSTAPSTTEQDELPSI